MKLKSIMAISASILLVGANLFVISAKQGSVNCKSLLSKTLSFNHFAFAGIDAGVYDNTMPHGDVEVGEIANCSVLEIESYGIDVKLRSTAGQKLKKYVDGNLNLSAEGIPYVSGKVVLSGGNSSDNSSNDDTNVRIIGDMYINVMAARPRYIYCDYQNHIPCKEHVDPCNELKDEYRKQAIATFCL